MQGIEPSSPKSPCKALPTRPSFPQVLLLVSTRLILHIYHTYNEPYAPFQYMTQEEADGQVKAQRKILQKGQATRWHYIIILHSHDQRPLHHITQLVKKERNQFPLAPWARNKLVHGWTPQSLLPPHACAGTSCLTVDRTGG